ncbi:glycoside hydrolase family 18 protein [Dysgonomonas macrotermitis]|uniref:chitinase n=1 Tax=Dysgonomonas macrotermitis TaxID=1346286 RepID=A0A1M5E309_9BACT|nr:glycosyl hydrolase family 18 protein [Dysgonomonas macrotermitis]SHF73462.1 chitinase [Dysgonomonas macrotermitis]
MKKLTLLFVFILGICIASKSQETFPAKLNKTPVVLAYVTAGSDIMPDPNYVTHINYAFGHVSETFNSIDIDNEARLRQIAALKSTYPHLKVMLSVGGWTSGRFSEMAASVINRRSFVNDCKRVIDEFGLDGVDLDWEYPTSSVAGISSSSDDTDNFTLLMKEIRGVIGEDRLLTLASACTAQYYDFKAIDQYIDFVNIMTYDMGRPPFHNAPLHRSEFTSDLSIEESVQAHVAAGISLDKLTLGMPFYGHVIKELGDFINYKDIHTLDEKYTRKWDDEGKVPYFTDKDGYFVCSFDNAESLAYKCRYALNRGMLGVMYWEYNGDDAEGTLRKTVYNTVMKK